jgi:23S rRNA (uracil1939-C5)-methyltransferase
VTPSDTVETTVDRLGTQGDGVAALADGKPLYVAGTAPGDRVRVALGKAEGNGVRGTLVEVVEAGPNRVAAPCAQFGTCGGCALQHLAPEVYRTWKRGLLVEALARTGVEAGEIGELVAVREGTRRRGTFFAEKRDGRVRAGFHERGSHRIAALEGCRVLEPALLALVERLPAIMADVLAEGERAEIVVNGLKTGLDVLVRLPQLPALVARERLARFAAEADLVRLSVGKAGSRDRTADAEPVVVRRPAVATFGGIEVALPPGAFLQASADAEAVLVRAAHAGVKGAARIADLFAGAGTFAFALAAGGGEGAERVHAVEGDASLAAALRAGAAKAGLGARITTEVRDLFRRPLDPRELDRFDAVLFDPPRVGAKDQAAALARSKVPRVVGVSCNPQTFARDARMLQEGGYRLTRVVPVDQFLWTHHLEVVGAFVRK